MHIKYQFDIDREILMSHLARYVTNIPQNMKFGYKTPHIVTSVTKMWKHFTIFDKPWLARELECLPKLAKN